MKIRDESGNTVSGLYRDQLGNIIAKPNEEYNKYLLEKKRHKQISELISDVDYLKSEVSHIKSMLLELINKGK